MNVHSPVRQADESQEQYRERRRMSKVSNQRATRTGPYNTARGSLNARESLRDEQRKNGNLKGVYGAGLRAHFDRQAASASAARLMRKVSR